MKLVYLLLLCALPMTAANYRLVDRDGNMVMPIVHGTTIDLHTLADRNYLQIQASFGSSKDHATWVEFTLIHSKRAFDYARTSSSPDGGWWSVCLDTCYRLKVTGSVMLKAKVWFRDDHPSPAVGVIESDSVTFRITDSKPTKPKIRPPAPGRISRPTCHGDPDACKAIVGNASLWEGLGRLCETRPGADIGLGNGATMRCP